MKADQLPCTNWSSTRDLWRFPFIEINIMSLCSTTIPGTLCVSCLLWMFMCIWNVRNCWSVREWASSYEYVRVYVWVSVWVTEWVSEPVSEWLCEWVCDWVSEWVSDWVSVSVWLRFGRGWWYLLHNGLWSETTTTRNAAATSDVHSKYAVVMLYPNRIIIGCGFPQHSC